MDQRNLTDKSVQPTDAIIFSHIGENRKWWEQLMNTLNKEYPDLVMEWKYYKDAGSWLLPVARKKKNLCWISLKDNSFVAGFWFGNKVGTLVESSDLSGKIKDDYRKAESNKMGRGLAISVSSETDLEEVFELIKFKYPLK